MESLSSEIRSLVSQISSENDITNYRVEVNSSVSKEGDGYIGIVNGLSIIDKDSERKLNLVLKKAPTNENLRRQFPTRILFLREIHMYEVVFPDFLKFQDEYNIPNPFNSVTKLYGYIDEEFKEALLLRNLKEDGYKMCKRQEPLDSHHLSLVITEYAKFHALSHAMRKLEPERFEKIKDHLGDVMKNFGKQMPKEDGPETDSPSVGPSDAQIEALFGPTMEAIKNKPKELEALEKFKNDSTQFMFNNELNEHSVVSHGDCWSTNLLFKYEDEESPKIPTKLCLIDWQLSMVRTAIYDLSYFLFINAGKDDLHNYKKYLHLYHTALSQMLSAFGLDVEEVYSFELFEQEWKDKAPFGFVVCLVMLPQTLSEGKTHDFEELAKDGKSIFDINERKLEVSELFKQRMGDLMEFLVEHNIL